MIFSVKKNYTIIKMVLSGGKKLSGGKSPIRGGKSPIRGGKSPIRGGKSPIRGGSPLKGGRKTTIDKLKSFFGDKSLDRTRMENVRKEFLDRYGVNFRDHIYYEPSGKELGKLVLKEVCKLEGNKIIIEFNNSSNPFGVSERARCIFSKNKFLGISLSEDKDEHFMPVTKGAFEVKKEYESKNKEAKEEKMSEFSSIAAFERLPEYIRKTRYVIAEGEAAYGGAKTKHLVAAEGGGLKNDIYFVDYVHGFEEDKPLKGKTRNSLFGFTVSSKKLTTFEWLKAQGYSKDETLKDFGYVWKRVLPITEEDPNKKSLLEGEGLMIGENKFESLEKALKVKGLAGGRRGRGRSMGY